jgi:hypothetical protein
MPSPPPLRAQLRRVWSRAARGFTGLRGTAILLAACLAAAVAGARALDGALHPARPGPDSASDEAPPPVTVPSIAVDAMKAMLAAEGTLPRGTAAPDFTLPDVRTGQPVRLASFRGRRPVVLVFGSFG